MRNLSFALTTRQMRERTKTVTRRKGTWWSKVLKPGDLVCAVEKSQGIPKGGLVRLGVIRVVSVRTEPLNRVSDPGPLVDEYGPYGFQETAREGFPGWGGGAFVKMFLEHMGGDYRQVVTRIEFEHVEPQAVPR